MFHWYALLRINEPTVRKHGIAVLDVFRHVVAVAGCNDRLQQKLAMTGLLPQSYNVVIV